MFCLTVLDQCPQGVWGKGLLTLFPLLPWVGGRSQNWFSWSCYLMKQRTFLRLRKSPRFRIGTPGAWDASL